jgi:NAD(P)-dependent dehydrogenase (short-subunit alcohol dehydrogenase family)
MSAEHSHEGRTAIVTGAAGGVGAATVDLLRTRGASVVAVDLRSDGLGRYVDDPGVQIIVGDVADPATAAAAVAAARDRFGGVDLLVNNAGRFVVGAFVDSSVDDWDGAMRINVRSMYLFSKAVVPEFVARGGGSIVNLASIAGLTGAAGQVIYSATKGAIIALTRGLAIELASQNVRVNAVAPGAIDTNFARDAMVISDEDYAAQLELVAAAHPLGRIATPEQVAEAIVFLGSDASAFTTGIVFPVDGGWTAQ